jgi:7-cyano-7-deazaguanine synthase in queuosine biosynthesis
MDDSVKEINFDLNGQCNFCREYKDKEFERRIEKQNLPWLIHKIKKEGRCLLGLSGGADSSTCLLLLLEQGIKPITFSLDNGWEDKNANENVKNLVKKTGVEHEVVKINFSRFRALQDAYMKAGVPNIEVPTDHILMALTYKIARKYGCKYVISGGNLSTESIMPESWSFSAKDLTNMRDIARQYGATTKGLPTISLLQYIWNRFVRGIKIINLLDYYEYNRQKSINRLKEEYDYKDYGDKHEENPFTQWFQNYFLPARFGIDKRKAHYSSLICSGQMTREEALEKLKNNAPYQDLKFNLGVPKSHYYFKTSSFWWNLFSKIYRTIK